MFCLFGFLTFFQEIFIMKLVDILTLKAITFFTIGVFNLLIALLLWRKGKSKATFHLGFVGLFSCLFALSFWGAYFFWEKNSFLGELFTKATWLGVLMLPAFITFIYYFSEKTKNLKIKSFSLYLVAITISLLALFTSLFIKKLYLQGTFIEDTPGALEPLGRIYILFCIILGLTNLLRYYFKATGLKRLQVKYLILGIIFYALGGIIAAGLIPLFFKTALYVEFVPYFSVIWVALTAYTILKYRLMDIQVAIGRGLMYFLSFLTVILVALLFALFNQYLEHPMSFTTAVPFIALLSIFLFQIIKYFERVGAKYFYPEFYQTKIAILELEERLKRVLELKTLGNLLNNTLKNTFQLEKIAILIKDLETKDFQILSNLGFRKKILVYFLKNDFLHCYLEITSKPLIREEMPALVEKKKGEEKIEFQALEKEMEKIKAAILLPLLFQRDLIGIIILGEKTSKEAFSAQDIKLLATVSHQASIALKNATLFAKLRKRKEELENFYRLTVDRELKMVKLQRRIQELEEKLKEKGTKDS